MARVSPRLISLKIDGTDRSNEITKAVIRSAKGESDFMSFTEARSGGSREYTLEMTVAQDHASGTLWDKIWTGNGTEVPGIYAPFGNTTATVAQPHYTFTAVVAEPEGDFLGAESTDSTSAVAVIEVEWKLTAKPVKVTA